MASFRTETDQAISPVLAQTPVNPLAGALTELYSKAFGAGTSVLDTLAQQTAIQNQQLAAVQKVKLAANDANKELVGKGYNVDAAITNNQSTADRITADKLNQQYELNQEIERRGLPAIYAAATPDQLKNMFTNYPGTNPDLRGLVAEYAGKNIAAQDAALIHSQLQRDPSINLTDATNKVIQARMPTFTDQITQGHYVKAMQDNVTALQGNALLMYAERDRSRAVDGLTGDLQNHLIAGLHGINPLDNNNFNALVDDYVNKSLALDNSASKENLKIKAVGVLQNLISGPNNIGLTPFQAQAAVNNLFPPNADKTTVDQYGKGVVEGLRSQVQQLVQGAQDTNTSHYATLIGAAKDPVSYLQIQHNVDDAFKAGQINPYQHVDLTNKVFEGQKALIEAKNNGYQLDRVGQANQAVQTYEQQKNANDNGVPVPMSVTPEQYQEAKNVTTTTAITPAHFDEMDKRFNAALNAGMPRAQVVSDFLGKYHVLTDNTIKTINNLALSNDPNQVAEAVSSWNAIKKGNPGYANGLLASNQKQVGNTGTINSVPINDKLETFARLNDTFGYSPQQLAAETLGVNNGSYTQFSADVNDPQKNGQGQAPLLSLRQLFTYPLSFTAARTSAQSWYNPAGYLPSISVVPESVAKDYQSIIVHKAALIQANQPGQDQSVTFNQAFLGAKKEANQAFVNIPIGKYGYILPKTVLGPTPDFYSKLLDTAWTAGQDQVLDQRTGSYVSSKDLQLDPTQQIVKNGEILIPINRKGGFATGPVGYFALPATEQSQKTLLDQIKFSSFNSYAQDKLPGGGQPYIDSNDKIRTQREDLFPAYQNYEKKRNDIISTLIRPVGSNP